MSDNEIIVLNTTDKKFSEEPSRAPLPVGWKQEKREDGMLYTIDEKGELICGAWNSKRKKYCRQVLVPGKNRCHYHGGKSPRGIESSRYKHGGYSKDMPEKLAKRWQDGMSDTELLSLRADVALVKASISERLASLQEGEAGELWIRGRNTYREMLTAIKRQDEAESTRLVGELGSILNKGYDDTIAMREIHKKQDVLRKLVSEERKRLVDMRHMVTIEELMLVVGALVDSLKKHVHDTEALGHVSADLRKLLQDRGYADR